jgi:hypothetical protein
MPQFISVSSLDHLMSIRTPNVDFLGQAFNRTGNTMNGLKVWKQVGEKSPGLIIHHETDNKLISKRNCNHSIPYLPPCISKCKLPAHQSLDIFWARKKEILGQWLQDVMILSMGLGEFLFYQNFTVKTSLIGKISLNT